MVISSWHRKNQQGRQASTGGNRNSSHRRKEEAHNLGMGKGRGYVAGVATPQPLLPGSPPAGQAEGKSPCMAALR